MVNEYRMSSTSLQSARLEDRELAVTFTTRLILRPEVVENPNNPEAGVKISLIHQRKNKNESWEDVPTPPLSSLKAGEIAKLSLNCDKTLNLYTELRNLYAISSSGGVRIGETNLVVGQESEFIKVDQNRARVIELLLQHDYPAEIWNALVEKDPDLATKLSYARVHSERAVALQEYDSGLSDERDESWWQEFFDRNTWIFGYGLDYRVLKAIQAQPHYGGTDLGGRGGQRGDFLRHTEAVTKFTVLVEIKRPDTRLLGKVRYRAGAWKLEDELTGGVSQLQMNCRKWEIEGSRAEANQDRLTQNAIFTVQPKGILVIGRLNELVDNDRRNTFELFRRNIANPEILTFDELYERAKFIVDRSSDALG